MSGWLVTDNIAILVHKKVTLIFWLDFSVSTVSVLDAIFATPANWVLS